MLMSKLTKQLLLLVILQEHCMQMQKLKMAYLLICKAIQWKMLTLTAELLWKHKMWSM